MPISKELDPSCATDIEMISYMKDHFEHLRLEHLNLDLFELAELYERCASVLQSVENRLS